MQRQEINSFLYNFIPVFLLLLIQVIFLHFILSQGATSAAAASP